MKYYIWQLPVSNSRCFREVDYEEIDLSDYVFVYVYITEETEPNLERLFQILNIEHPDDYYARSLSVSDLIVVKEDNKEEYEYYVVDSIGFKKVNEKDNTIV